MKPELQQGKFLKFFRRFVREGWLKACFVALTFGFAVSAILATVMWFTGTNALWYCLATVPAVTLVGMPILYMVFFRPTVKSNARRIDRLGLEERIVTMVELEHDDSVLSRLQREDARKHLEAADEKQIQFRVTKKMAMSLSVAASLGCIMTALSVLAALGYITSGADLLEPLLPESPDRYIYVEYIVDEGGFIEGEEFQEIIVGERGTQVIAVAEEGWTFVGWEDGFSYPERTDGGYDQDQIFVALFEPTGENGDGEGDGQDTGNVPPDKPKPSDSGGNSDISGDEHNDAAGGRFEPANQIINGQVFYRDVLADYLDMIEQYLASGEEIPEIIRKIVEAYKDSIS